MTDALTLRVSQLPRYNDCPRSNSLRFMRAEAKEEGHELLDALSSIAAAIGTGTHGVMAELFKQKMSYGYMNLKEAVAVREKDFLDEVARGVIWDTTTMHMDAAKAQLAALCGAFLPVAEMIQPMQVEYELTYLVSPLGSQAIPVYLVGHPDVKDIRYEIHDHKTGSEFPPCHAQLGGYALLEMYHERQVSAVRVNYGPRLPVSKLHELKVRSIRFDLDECLKEAWRAISDIQAHYMRWRETKDPHSFPANPYSQSCTEKYCSAYGTSYCRVGAIC